LDSQIEIVLVGPKATIESELQQRGEDPAGFPILEADQVVGMDEGATSAIRNKPQSSLVLGVQHLSGQALDVFISAGNTGAFLSAAVMMLGLQEGVMRPSIGALYPHEKGYSFLCDVGANTDCKPELLRQFGIMGAIFMQAVMGIAQPRVALMNIGEEKSKGTQAVQQAYQLLESTERLNFIGNAEGRDLVAQKSDVYVMDGFTGNILLKFAESFYYIFKKKMPDDPDIENFNFQNIGGLPFLGVNGNVVLGHGISNAEAFKNMIYRGRELVEVNLQDKISKALQGMQAEA
jgi:glycerol-3-phosphate acyltransferase PlsX